ncbi:hypothetical protein SSS_07307 [Sarcoptes scabiei]|nr:hypothetical protein SSS_07307 [Sarcoptes scabiei]
MEVFLKIRRKNTTIFLDCNEETPVRELKKMIEGITKVPVNDQRLFKDEQLMDDYKTMAECNLTSNTAKAQSPATIGLAFRSRLERLNPSKLYHILLHQSCLMN